MGAKAEVVNEIMVIADLFESGECDTPGGLEHMGDVRRLFLKWKKKLQVPQEAAKPITWTTTKPSKPGMWWWRSSDKQSQWIEEIDLRDGRLAVIGTAGHVFIDGEYGGEWSSESIAEPEEAS